MQPSVFADVLGFSPSKSQRAQMKIIQGAIQCYSSIGYDRTTFEKVAKTTGLSRGLIQHYFGNRDKLFEVVIDVVRKQMTEFATREISSFSNPRDQLLSYVRGCLEWVSEFPDHSRVWGIYYHYCSIRIRLKNRNTEYVRIGEERIEGLLELGRSQKIFKCKRPAETAKLIQVTITGAMITLATEKLSLGESEFKEIILSQCLQLASG